MMVKVMVMIRTGVTIVIMLTSGREWGGGCHDYAGDWNPVLAEKEECANVRKADSILFLEEKKTRNFIFNSSRPMSVHSSESKKENKSRLVSINKIFQTMRLFIH